MYLTSSCSGGTCTPGQDKALSAGTTISGTLQIFVSAKADLGLEFVRLEAQTGTDPTFYCLEFWDANGALEFRNDRVWRTHRWTDPRAECDPGICSGCLENSEHLHGNQTTNGEYRIRVVAREQGQFTDANDAHSPLFSIKLSNAATAPGWLSEPTSNGKPDPTVVLRWSTSPEPDVAEYQFIREDPSGVERVFAVSASNPQRNGCSRASDIAYSCANGDFPQSGTYRYALRALRPGSGTTCATTKGACVASKVGPVRTVSVTVASSPGASASPAGSGIAAPSPAPLPTGQEPLALPPSDGASTGDGLIAPPAALDPAGSTGRSAPAIALAAGLALGVGVVLARRRVLHRKGDPS